MEVFVIRVTYRLFGTSLRTYEYEQHSGPYEDQKEAKVIATQENAKSVKEKKRGVHYLVGKKDEIGRCGVIAC